MSRVLGAVLAGGRSSRFGSDKASAVVHGRTLLDHAVAALAAQCEAVVIVGRGGVPDWPEPGRGPLGGIAGALVRAQAAEFQAVLSCGVDSYGLPSDLLSRLAPAPSCLSDQPIVGLWRVADLGAARAMLTGAGGASVRRFAEQVGARCVILPCSPRNLNTPRDLADLIGECGP